MVAFGGSQGFRVNLCADRRQIGAMIISSATGLVLDRSVNRYKGFALLAISITGIAGSIGAIQ